MVTGYSKIISSNNQRKNLSLIFSITTFPGGDRDGQHFQDPIIAVPVHIASSCPQFPSDPCTKVCPQQGFYSGCPRSCLPPVSTDRSSISSKCILLAIFYRPSAQQLLVPRLQLFVSVNLPPGAVAPNELEPSLERNTLARLPKLLMPPQPPFGWPPLGIGCGNFNLPALYSGTYFQRQVGGIKPSAQETLNRPNNQPLLHSLQ